MRVSFALTNSVCSFVAPYLLLLSFYSGNLISFDAAKIKSINDSPYDGVAVALNSAYDLKDYQEADFELTVANIKRDTRKHVWPWVFLNRIIGYQETTGRAAHPDRAKAFGSIKGMDIYGKTGALNSLYQNTRLALRIAKKLGSPGIVLDMESYNNYKTYQVGYLAQEMGRTIAEIECRLREVGVAIADITAQEYPTATIWFTFTGIGNSSKTMGFQKQHTTVTYIAQGLLQRIQDQKYPIKVVSGGMLSGYCYESLKSLKDAIQNRKGTYRQPLDAYPALRLAGTIALWRDAKEKQEGYFKNDECGKCPVQNLQQFSPYLEEIFTSYEYVWIYAAAMVNYNPYNPSIAAEYNTTIELCLKKIQ